MLYFQRFLNVFEKSLPRRRGRQFASHFFDQFINNGLNALMRLKRLTIITVSLSVLFLSLSSCGSSKLVTRAVRYQSIRPVPYRTELPPGISIAVAYDIDYDGNVSVLVKNMTDEIMTIDQTKSFFVNSNGISISYYDPTVRVESTTEISSKTRGGSVNMGAVGGFLGVTGPAVGLLNGINLGGAKTEGISKTNASYFSDMPQISLSPKSSGVMSKIYKIDNYNFNNGAITSMNNTYSQGNSSLKFSVCISYSLDGGKTFDKIVTDFYANSRIICPVDKHGEVNDALREVFILKNDALNEPFWQIDALANGLSSKNHIKQGSFINYK